VVSRGDSTLRGHFPLEVEAIQAELGPFDATLLVPAFLPGGRTTRGGVHYLHGQPVHTTDFARDRLFGFSSSFLPEWVAEKTRGAISADAVERLDLAELDGSAAVLQDRLAGFSAQRLVAVDAERPEQLAALGEAVWRSERRQLLRPTAPAQQGRTVSSQTLAALDNPQSWSSLHWSAATTGRDAQVLELQPGALVAVAGPSGGGKTTLLDRVCGLLGEDSSQWQITSQTGAIELSGSAGARQLRGLLAYAPQEAVLFETSLRQNLLLDQQAPAGVIEGWLERLGLSHLCQRGSGLDDPLPLALDHFSGGEIHRLGLLRAWLRNRPVEVLDEPTAFLDAESAQRVREIIAERARERLVLVSTHDPELIKQAGKVLRLQVSDRQRAERLHHG